MMNLRIYWMTAVIALVLSGVAAFIDYRVSLGILAAACFSMFNLYLLSLSMKSVLKQENANTGMLMGTNMLRFALLAVLIYIAIKNPQIFSLIGVTIGMVLFLIALVIDAFRNKGGE